MKKTKRLLGLFFLVFTLLAGSLSVFANSDIEAKYGVSKDQIESYIESLLGQLQSLSDEELNQYKSMGDPAVVSWLEISDSVGGFVEVLGDKADYEITDDGFIGEIPVKMEKTEIVVKLEFSAANGTVNPTFSIGGTDGDRMGLGSILKKAGVNTLIGMGTVFVMLIFISLLIWLLGFVPKLLGGKKKEAEPVPAAPAPVAEQISARETAKADDSELVAVIAAAIAAATGSSTDSFVVRSIRKVKRS